jgi:hypothetical protein
VRVAAFLLLVGIVTGPALTLALVVTALPLIWINLIGSFIFVLLIPYVALGETLLYFDLQARAEAEPAKPRRCWRLWRPRQFGRRPSPRPPVPAPESPHRPFDRDPEQPGEEQRQGEEGNDAEAGGEREREDRQQPSEDQVDEERAPGAGAGRHPPRGHSPPPLPPVAAAFV